MSDMSDVLTQWQMDAKAIRDRIYRATTPRERERWHALWLLSLGWPAARVAEAMGRDAHTIGQWLERFRQSGPEAMAFEQSGGPPPFLTRQHKGN